MPLKLFKHNIMFDSTKPGMFFLGVCYHYSEGIEKVAEVQKKLDQVGPVDNRPSTD